MTLAHRIKQEARSLGFQAVGISHVIPTASSSPTDSSSPTFDRTLYARLVQWLQAGYQGTMSWMERNPHRRANPQQVLPGCQSIISVGLNYFTEYEADECSTHGRIARYAWGQDYHQVLLDKLQQLEEALQQLAPQESTRCYVDTGPVMEKAWAQQGGLGWIGKHSNLVSTDYGSWLLLGEILTTLPLEADEPGIDLCGSCTLCMQACPTEAIPEPYVLDARKCISYLTIEFKGEEQEIPQDLANKMGNRIFGCDDCLDICPFNINAAPSSEPAFQPSFGNLAPHLPSLLSLNQEDFQTKYKRSPLRRPKFSGFMRNLRIAFRNFSRSRPTPPALS